MRETSFQTAPAGDGLGFDTPGSPEGPSCFGYAPLSSVLDKIPSRRGHTIYEDTTMGAFAMSIYVLVVKSE